VGSIACSTLFFARCGSCAAGVECWPDAVVGCVGVGVHKAVAERVCIYIKRGLILHFY
jgi:hypothetical protein